MKGELYDTMEEFERAAAAQPAARYTLRLFVAGASMRSKAAVANVKSICERFLAGRYELEVVDVYQQPALARSEQLVAAPTLVKRLPKPERRIVGDMSDEHRVLIGLDLRSRP
ncbi:MAG: circadian clock KaiB family protein [Phycisphaerales bacterium]